MHNTNYIDEILHDYQVIYGDSESFNMFKDIVDNCRINASKGSKKIESSEYSKLFRKELVSSIIYTLILTLIWLSLPKAKIHYKNTWDKEIGFSTYSELSGGLKRLTFQCINHNDEVYFYEQTGGKIIKKYSSYTWNILCIYRLNIG
jgi:dGTPase